MFEIFEKIWVRGPWQVWDRSRGRLENLAMGFFLVSIMFLYPKAYSVKWGKKLISNIPPYFLYSSFSRPVFFLILIHLYGISNGEKAYINIQSSADKKNH